MLSKLSVKMQILMMEHGQDLVEYAMVIALLALGATAGMQTLATDLNTTFTNVGTKLVRVS